MTALRCTQKLLTAMKVAPSVSPATGANRLGDWSLNLLHTRPKLVVAISEHDRLSLVLEAAPYATLPQRFKDAVFVQLLAIGVPPDLARRERDAAVDHHRYDALCQSPEPASQPEGLRLDSGNILGGTPILTGRNKRAAG